MGIDVFEQVRRLMVQEQLSTRGIHNKRVLEAMATVPRHMFVDPEQYGEAYADHPVSIGHGQTVSQPYMVALMLQVLDVQQGERVLEVGTGSGYQAAVLSRLGAQVHTIERIDALHQRARACLAQVGVTAVECHLGDGSVGWSPAAPYAGIIVAAGAPTVPGPLCEQLASAGGRLVVPVGQGTAQSLMHITRQGDQTSATSVTSCVFVPLVGEAGWRKEDV